VTGGYDHGFPINQERQLNMVSSIAKAGQAVIQSDRIGWERPCNRLDQRCHAAMQSACAIVKPLVVDAFCFFIRFTQMQHAAFIMLGVAAQSQLLHKRCDEGLSFWPIPASAKIQPAAAACRRAEYAAAKAVARLEYFEA
jgi:hypothetical protein